MSTYTPSTVTYHSPKGTTLISLCAMSDFIQGKQTTLYRDKSWEPRYSTLEPLTDINSSHGFRGGVDVKLSGCDSIPDLDWGTGGHPVRSRQMHSITVKRRNSLTPTHASPYSQYQQDCIVSKDGVFHIPRAGSNAYRASWDAGTYEVDIIDTTPIWEGIEEQISGLSAAHWQGFKVKVEGIIGGGYEDKQQREWGQTTQLSEGSMMANNDPEEWCTHGHMEPVDDRNRQLAGMVDALVGDDEA